jgi:putative sterol carrier protein
MSAGSTSKGVVVFEEMVADMKACFRKGVFNNRTSFLFIIDDQKLAVVFDADSFTVAEGTPEGKLDCSCSISSETFKKIWFDGYRPGFMDFLNGAIKADQPLLLPQFLKAFGKA